jgi:hypothetical protein
VQAGAHHNGQLLQLRDVPRRPWRRAKASDFKLSAFGIALEILRNLPHELLLYPLRELFLNLATFGATTA